MIRSLCAATHGRDVTRQRSKGALAASLRFPVTNRGTPLRMSPCISCSPSAGGSRMGIGGFRVAFLGLDDIEVVGVPCVGNRLVNGDRVLLGSSVMGNGDDIDL